VLQRSSINAVQQGEEGDGSVTFFFFFSFFS
jgi:hypothetical protein